LIAPMRPERNRKMHKVTALPAFFVAAICCLFSLEALSQERIDEEYMASLFAEPGKAQREFEIVVAENPLLAAYFLGLFSESVCGNPKPSDTLYEAAGGGAALETAEGERAFAVAGVIATMSYPTPAEKESACENARELVEAAEDIATEPR
jgi:hypothetical protein